MENYVNNITFQIKLQIKEIILLAYCEFTNAWKFTPITMDLKITHYNSCNFTPNFFAEKLTRLLRMVNLAKCEIMKITPS